ncbi:hypothetical protein [Streptomyces sp. NPDC003247]|uniref:hypothetical protein n=1 Tax=Streptomyces sp. NPDC003247 TaxID=3364677 RepID=UPI0036A3B841
MPQALGHEESWQEVTLSAKAIKKIKTVRTVRTVRTVDSIGVETAVGSHPRPGGARAGFLPGVAKSSY